MRPCDLTRRETFSNMEHWISSFQSVAGERPIVLIGNKCDLEEYVMVTESAMQKRAKKMEASYFLTSAKSGQNVEEAFEAMAQGILKV